MIDRGYTPKQGVARVDPGSSVGKGLPLREGRPREISLGCPKKAKPFSVLVQP